MAMRLSTKTDKPKDTKGALKRLLKYCFEYKFRLCITIIMCFCGNLIQASPDVINLLHHSMVVRRRSFARDIAHDQVPEIGRL